MTLLERIEETPRVEYPTPTKLDEEIIKQVLEFREQRAAPGLRRIVRFNPLATPPGHNPFGRNRIGTVALAVEALGAIEGDSALAELGEALRVGLAGHTGGRVGTGGLISRIRSSWGRKRDRNSDELSDPMAAIRYHAVLGLMHCRSDRAKALLEIATKDPRPEIAAFARDALVSKEADA